MKGADAGIASSWATHGCSPAGAPPADAAAEATPAFANSAPQRPATGMGAGLTAHCPGLGVEEAGPAREDVPHRPAPCRSKLLSLLPPLAMSSPLLAPPPAALHAPPPLPRWPAMPLLPPPA